MLKKLKRHEIAQNGSINMTPLIDVVLQLLIFLMLTSSLARPNRIELDLPESTSGVKAAEKPLLVVTYRSTDNFKEITLNDEILADFAELNSKLRASENSPDSTQVDIKVDRLAPYQDVVMVIDSVRDAGFYKFSLLTLAPGQSESK